MKKLIALFAMFVVIVNSACTPSGLPPSSLQPGDEYTITLPLDKFQTGIDFGTGCTGFPATLDDAAVSMQGENLHLVANPRRIPGLFVGAIAHVNITSIWTDDSRYTLSGEFRKSGGQIEQIDVNLQFTEANTENPVEVGVYYNPHSPDYRWLWTRGGNLEVIKLMQVPDDENWHRFSIMADYIDNTNQRIIRSISFDGNEFILDLQTDKIKKEYEYAFVVLLETVNMYTSCDPTYTFVGKSEWRNVRLDRAALP